MFPRFLRPVCVYRILLRRPQSGPQCHYRKSFLFSKRKFHSISMTKHSTPKIKKDYFWNHNILRFYASLPEHTKIPFPALSPTMETGNLVNWLKKEGDQVNQDDPVCEIETDKAVMTFDSPQDGWLAKILIPAGTQGVKVGSNMCIFVEKKEDIGAFKDYKEEGAKPPAEKPPPAEEKPPAKEPEAPAKSSKRGRVSLMEIGLAEAKKRRQQKPSKPGPPVGLSADGAKAPKKAPKKGKPGIPSEAEYVDIPLTPTQIELSARLLEIKRTVPHFMVSINCNLDKLIDFKDKCNTMFARQKLNLKLNDFIMKAAATAFHRHPDANAVWFGDCIKKFSHVDMSVAFYNNGFSTPTLRGLDYKGVIQISKETEALTEEAEEGAQVLDYEGGVMLVVDLSEKDIDQIMYIVNPFQTAVLGIGKLFPKLILNKNEPKGYRLVHIANISVTGDHRVMDGALAALWLKTFKMVLEDPAQMIL